MCKICLCECHMKDSLSFNHENYQCCEKQGLKYLYESSSGEISIEYIIYYPIKDKYFLTYGVDKRIIGDYNEGHN